MTDMDRLSQDYAVRHPDAFARLLGRGPLDECELVIDSLPAAHKASIVARLPAIRIRQLIDTGRHTPARWLADAPLDDAVSLLSRLPRERLLRDVNSVDNRERQRRLLRQLQYPAHSVGALVVDIPLRVNAETPAADVVEELRGLDTESTGPVVVVDNKGHYVGVLDRLRLLLRSHPTGSTADYSIAVTALRPETQVDDVARIDDWHTRNWLPVIDQRDRVLGAVSRESVFRQTKEQRAGSGGDLFVDLLADLVYLAESLLLRMLSGREKT